MLRNDQIFRHLYDLRDRTFLEADFPDDDLAVCYGCSLPFLVGVSTERRVFLTTAANESSGAFLPMRSSDKQVFWVCRTCFEDYAVKLRFEVNTSWTLDQILAVHRSALLSDPEGSPSER